MTNDMSCATQLNTSKIDRDNAVVGSRTIYLRMQQHTDDTNDSTIKNTDNVH